MKTNRIRQTALAMVFASTMVAFGVASTQVRADLVDPNLFLEYSSLKFSFTRTAAPGALGTVGTFTIQDIGGSAMNAILRNGLGLEIDRATIANSGSFDVLLAGSVIRVGTSDYRLMGTLTATDYYIGTPTTVVQANFEGSVINFAELMGATYFFQIAGSLGAPGGILLPPTDPWTFSGQPGAINPDSLNVGGDNLIQVPYQVSTYDVGNLVEFHLGGVLLPDGSTQDTFFGTDVSLGGGDMKVTIVPAPAAVVLGLFGLGAVGWYMRRYA